MCSRSSITMPSLVELGFHPLPGWPKTLSFFDSLSVCLSVTLVIVRVCAPDFAKKALEYRNDFDTVGYEKVCSCAPVFNFLRFMLVGDITKNGKNFATRGRQNKLIETKFGT